MAEKDLTRTGTIRSEYTAEMYKRFRPIKGTIREAIEKNDIFNLKPSKPFTMKGGPNPGEFIGKSDSKKIDKFMDWLEGTENEQVLEEDWQNPYVKRAYSKGVEDADSEMRKKGIEIGDTRTYRILTLPIHAKALQMLYTRNFMELQGIVNVTNQRVSRKLANGFEESWNISKFANKINDRIDKIGITRAKTLARTETVHSHYKATINRYKEHNVEKVRFIYGGGPCPSGICPGLAGRTYKIGNQPSLPLHPNGGCKYSPVIGG